MTGRLLRRGAGAAALAFAGLVVIPASPASAEPVITIASPAADAVLESASVTVRGEVASDTPLINKVKRITLRLKDATRTIDCTVYPCPFTWTVPAPLNGPYELSVTATEESRLLALEGAPVTSTRRFKVAVAPATPVLDTPRVTGDRTVELSWSRNTEADMLYYAVFRKDPGGTTFVPVSNKVTQPATGAKVTFTDLGTGAFNGGDYSYRVVAVRKGPSGDATTEAKSAASTAVSATVPIPTTTTSSTPPSTLSPGAQAPGTPASGPTTTAKPAPPAGVDLSGFLSARSQPITLPPITVPEPPDTGFKGTLPFGARPPGDELEDGEEDAVLPGDVQRRSIISIDGGGRPLVPVAGGLVLLLLATHMRLLGRRVRAIPDADLPVGRTTIVPTVTSTTATARPAPARAPRVTPPRPQPAPPIPDVEAAGDDERAWAPFPETGGDEVEVFEVVSSNRRPLVRAGSR